MGTDVVQMLAEEVIGAQRAIYNALVGLGEMGSPGQEVYPASQIRADEIMYFVLTLTICSLFRWGHFENQEALADNLSMRILKLDHAFNKAPTRSQAIKLCQTRFAEYRGSLHKLTDNQIEFGLLLSRNMVRIENALIGTVLCGYSTALLADLENLITGAAN
jgi:hypothetical protein